MHLIAVPLFVVAHFFLIAGVLNPDGATLFWALGALLLSLLLQMRGHALEENHAPPFRDARDCVRRIYAEQFINFRQFVISGQWYVSWKIRVGYH